MTTLFTYKDGTRCNIHSTRGKLCVIKSTPGKPATDIIGFDAYQAALLIPELEKFIAQRSSHKVGDLAWRVTEGKLYINDVPVLHVGLNRETDGDGAREVVSKMLTRGRYKSLLSGLIYSPSDTQIEQWILDRIAALDEECDF